MVSKYPDLCIKRTKRKALHEREGRVLPFVRESEAEGVARANESVSRTATMSADEALHWDPLQMGYHVDRVNHSEIYSDHGKHTNFVESIFSRLRNMIEGQHHGVSAKYLHRYANQSAWLEDNRRTDNGTLAKLVVSNAMDAPLSRTGRGIGSGWHSHYLSDTSFDRNRVTFLKNRYVKD